MLVTGGLNDPRVQYWEPAKWVAKLRATKTDDNLLVLKMEMGAGHSGRSGRYDAWRDEAFVLAFLLDQLGLEPDVYAQPIDAASWANDPVDSDALAPGVQRGRITVSPACVADCVSGRRSPRPPMAGSAKRHDRHGPDAGMAAEASLPKALPEQRRASRWPVLGKRVRTRNGRAPRTRPKVASERTSDGAHVLGLVALATRSDVEFHLLTLFEGAVARPLDRGEVDEDVLATLSGDEAEALLRVEELHSSCSQLRIPSLPGRVRVTRPRVDGRLADGLLGLAPRRAWPGNTGRSGRGGPRPRPLRPRQVHLRPASEPRALARFSAAFSMRARSRCCLANVVRCFCGLTVPHYGRRPARSRIMATVPVEALSLTAEDGVVLEAERAPAEGTSRATAVLCHPHPQHGGTMRSIVVSALFEALPPAGVTCLRFNFRRCRGQRRDPRRRRRRVLRRTRGP